MGVYICQNCGHLEFNEVPDKCPTCGADKNMFKQNDDIFKESQEKSPEADVKHVPAVSIKRECGLIPEENCIDILIRIGKTLHPAKPEHFIQFIDIYVNNKFVERIQLTSNVNPAACIHMKELSGTVTVVEKCNIHGYWKADGNE